MRGVTRRTHQRSTNSRIRLIPIILRADIPDENQNPAGFPDAYLVPVGHGPMRGDRTVQEPLWAGRGNRPHQVCVHIAGQVMKQARPPWARLTRDWIATGKQILQQREGDPLCCAKPGGTPAASGHPAQDTVGPEVGSQHLGDLILDQPRRSLSFLGSSSATATVSVSGDAMKACPGTPGSAGTRNGSFGSVDRICPRRRRQHRRGRRAAERDKAARRRSARAALSVGRSCRVAQHSPFFACPGGQ